MVEAVYCATCQHIKDGNSNNCDECKINLMPGASPSKYIKFQEEDKKMNIVICGSMSKKESMLNAKRYFERYGHQVSCPCDNGRAEMPLLEKQSSWIEKIKEADLVVAIPKELKMEGNSGSNYILNFGESTSWEMAIALSFNKHVLFW